MKHKMNFARYLAWFCLGMMIFHLFSGDMISAIISFVSYYLLDLRSDLDNVLEYLTSKKDKKDESN